MIALLAGIVLAQAAIVVDNFESVAAWKAVPSDDVTLKIGQDVGVHGKSIRIDFDFHGHGGYAVIHRDVNLSLPANYEFSFSIRGKSPVNTLEFKLIDPSGDNVWWSNQPGFDFPSDWRRIVRKKRHISFAWGPLGGGDMKTVAGIEIAITAGTGGKGTVWIDDLELTQLEPDAPYNLRPRVTATSSANGFPASRIIDGDAATEWRSPRSTKEQTINVDFLKRREFGGIVLDWGKNRPSSYSVATSIDGKVFERVHSAGSGRSLRDYLYLPESDARYLRLSLAPTPDPVELREISVKPLEWSATKNDFFTAVAKDALPGTYPRYFDGKQSYWTVIGVNGDTREALIDEQGVLESGKGQFSVEPFLFTDGKLVTWNDATRTSHSAGNGLLIPSVEWNTPSLHLSVSGFAAGKPDSSVLYARYRVTNPTSDESNARLFLAIRPFQVNPPWQFLNTQGGVASIDSISWDKQRVHVNAARSVIPLTPGASFGAMSFSEGSLVDLLRQSSIPTATAVHDRRGFASGALAWNIHLRPNADTTIDIAIPLHDADPACARLGSLDACRGAWTANQLSTVETEWNQKLGRVAIQLPSSASRFTTSVRANLAYVLINRDGPSIQPGSRSYERSWIRDGALTSAALLRLGQFTEVKEFIDWYATFQFQNGKIPCCVDSRGADPVPENDSQGEFIYLVAEYFRHTGDRVLLQKMWPSVSRAFAFMDSLRVSRTTPEFEAADKRVFYGLMPQSISHEGYSAKPMHSYWDDFFALRGFKDAAEIARTLRKPEAARYATVRDQFRGDFYASIELAMKQHNIDYIPGAAELGDFDATSTTIAVNPGGETSMLPKRALSRTFEKYYENFVTRRDNPTSWEAYTPYEWRVVGTMIQLDERSKAHEVADFFFQDQRPAAWHQWAEVVWRDSLAPKFIGDMPHTWVGSDFIRSTLDIFAFERESDSTLVIGAGIPEKWVREENGVSIRGLSTHYGPLSYEMHPAVNAIEVRIEPGTRIPPGGIVVKSPSDRQVKQVTVNGTRVKSDGQAAVVRALPAVISFAY